MSREVWKARPVFLTSTFRDMHAERDHLRDYVFPVIDERLRERREYLEPIDLRQGIETLGEEEAQQRELLVLKVCLEEVSRSRPFLIGLIGDRYGWIPPYARMRAAASEAGFEGEIAGRSVTELEIAFGVLANPEQSRRSLFYFRQPLPYESMPAERAADFSEDYSNHEESPRGKQQLDRLKVRLRESIPDQCRTYHADWDPAASRVVNLDGWGQQVVEDLWRELDDETKEASREAPTSWVESERWLLEQFIFDRARSFVGREALLDSLFRFAAAEVADTGSSMICVVGDAGAGKSAVFAALNRRIATSAEGSDEELLVLSHSAGISPRSCRVDNLLELWISDLCLHLDVANPLSEAEGTEDVERVFRELIEQAALQSRVVLLIDALNQLENTARAQNLVWLPANWPPNVRVFVTTAAGQASEILSQRDNVELMNLAALSSADASSIVQSIYARYHRTVNSDVLEALLSVRREDQTAASSNPLWLTIAVEALNLLDEDDFARADRDYLAISDPGLRLQQLAVDTVAQMPKDITGMYSWLLERAETLHGKRFMDAIISLIAVGRGGWREQDLKSVVPVICREGWEEIRFAALRRTLRSHLVQRGTQAQWDFSHSYLRIAALERYVNTAKTNQRLHLALADYLESLAEDDPLRESESMIHLINSKQALRAAEFYADNVSGDAVRTIADYLREEAADSEQARVNWIADLHVIDGLKAHKRELIAGKTINELVLSVRSDVPLMVSVTLLENARLIFDELLAEEPGDTESERKINKALRPRWLLDLRTALMLLQVTHLQLGDEARGAKYRREAELLGRDAEHDVESDCLTGERYLFARSTDGQVSMEDISAAIEVNRRTHAEEDRLYFDYLKKSEQGDQPGMTEVAKARVEFAERVFAEAPDSPGRLTGPIETHRDLGRSYASIREFSLALTEFEIALAQARKRDELTRRELSVETGELAPEHEAFARRGTVVVKHDQTINADAGSNAFLRSVGAIPHLPTNTEGKVAEVLMDLGDLFLARVSTVQALGRFREAHLIAESCFERSPDDPQVINLVRRAEVGLADCQYLDGRYADAKIGYRKATRQLERRAAQEPNDVSVLRELAALYRQIGLACAELAERKEALSAFEQLRLNLTKLLDGRSTDRNWAIDEFEELFINIAKVHQSANDSDEYVKALFDGLNFAQDLAKRYPDEPNHKFNCARWWGRIGIAYAAYGNWNDAIRAFDEQIDGIDALSDELQTTEVCVSRIVAQIEQAKAQLASGNEAISLELVTDAIQSVEFLTESGADDRDIERILAVAQILKSAILQGRQEYDNAIDLLMRAQEISQRLVDQAPDNVPYLDCLFSALNNHARCLEAQGRHEGAVELFEQCLKPGRAVLESGQTDVNRILALLAAHTLIAAYRSGLGDFDGAFSAYEGGADLAESLAGDLRIDAQNLTGVFLTLENTGMLNQSRGNNQEAARIYKIAVKVAEQAASQLPAEVYWPQAHFTVSMRLSEVLLATGSVGDAVVVLQNLTDVATLQAETHPADEYWRRSEWAANYRLASALEQEENPISIKYWQYATDGLTRLERDGFSLSEEDRQCLSVTLEKCGPKAPR